MKSKVKLYMLTDTGKKFVSDITVSGESKIVINAEAKTPGSENQKLDVKLDNKLNSYSGTFITGNYEDYYLAINKLRIGQGILILDDILIIEVQ